MNDVSYRECYNEMLVSGPALQIKYRIIFSFNYIIGQLDLRHIFYVLWIDMVLKPFPTTVNYIFLLGWLLFARIKLEGGIGLGLGVTIGKRP